MMTKQIVVHGQRLRLGRSDEGRYVVNQAHDPVLHIANRRRCCARGYEEVLHDETRGMKPGLKSTMRELE